MTSKKACLIILDGWGIGKLPERSAIAQSKKPFFDKLWQENPHSTLVTFGLDVGLPPGQMGNSEVGHMNLGAGRVVYQELARIHASILDGSFFHEKALKETFEYAQKNQKPVHLMGLVSDGGVHSHIDHLLALCKMASSYDIPKVYIQAFTDGRDVDPKSGVNYIDKLQEALRAYPNQSIATICGRYYAMDRDHRWERIKIAYDALVNGVGELSHDYVKSMEENYKNGITDEFLKPLISSHKEGRISDGDAVIFFNFRTDRPRQLTEVLTQKAQPDYEMHPLDLYFTTMTKYDETYRGIHVVFNSDDLNLTLGEVLEQHGLTQVRIAETEKYPHVTFFFSGGREQPFKGEQRILVPSPKVATYDLQPEMSAVEVTHAIIKEIKANKPNFVCLNYANTDMVGHTGVFEAAVKATETVDGCLAQLIPLLKDCGYETLILADHGNSDYMINDDGSPNTAHSMNPVPLIFVSAREHQKKLKDGRLADIAPTILSLLGLERPETMTGEVLVV